MALLSSTICARFMLCVWTAPYFGFFDAQCVSRSIFVSHFCQWAGPLCALHHFYSLPLFLVHRLKNHSALLSIRLSLSLLLSRCYQLHCWRFTRFNYFWVCCFCLFRAIFPLRYFIVSNVLLSELEINYCFDRSRIQWTGFWYLIDFIMHFFPCLCIVNRNFSFFFHFTNEI